MSAQKLALEAAENAWFKKTGQLKLPIDAFEAAVNAYLSASGMVLVPSKATDEMKFHTLVAGYLAVGSEGDEALSLAKDKMNTEGYDEFSDAQYAAMLDAAPDPFKSQP